MNTTKTYTTLKNTMIIIHDISVYIKRYVCPSHFCLSPGTNNLFVPRGTNISHTQDGGQTFLTHRRGDKHFFIHRGGGQYVSRSKYFLIKLFVYIILTKFIKQQIRGSWHTGL